MQRKALTTGSVGPNVSSLDERLLNQSYEFHGNARRTLCLECSRMKDDYTDSANYGRTFFLPDADLSDTTARRDWGDLRAHAREDSRFKRIAEPHRQFWIRARARGLLGGGPTPAFESLIDDLTRAGRSQLAV